MLNSLETPFFVDVIPFVVHWPLPRHRTEDVELPAPSNRPKI